MKRVFTLLYLFAHVAMSQSIDTIAVGTPLKAFNKLEYGAYSFLVYSEREGKQSPQISFVSETSERIVDGRKLIAITHTWTGANYDGGFLALVESETFQPFIQIREVRGKKEAYQFSKEKIVGLDSVVDNAAKDYIIELPHPVFNFEIDIETFSILPIKEKTTLVVPFFHAGNEFSPPSYYNISVEGKEEIEIDGFGKKWCWILFIDYQGKQPTKFWYTVDDRQFVKMEGEYNGLKIYKIREF